MDFEEFYEWTIAREEETPESTIHDVVEFLFTTIDKDSSGTITPGELRNSLQSVGEQLSLEDVMELVREFDRDDDGHIDREEFESMLKKHME